MSRYTRHRHTSPKQKKATTTQSHKERQEQLRKEKEEREKEARKQVQQKPGAKLSKPEPARSPFLFFKEAHPKLDGEQLKAAWAALPENEKQVGDRCVLSDSLFEVYKAKSLVDKQREKEEKEKWAEAQALKQAQQNSKKGKERRWLINVSQLSIRNMMCFVIGLQWIHNASLLAVSG